MIMAGLIDTHTHLESFHRRGETEGVLARARAAGVEALVTVGTAIDDWALYRELSERHRGYVHYTAGLHPCAVEADWERQLEVLPGFWAEGVPPVALGEIGLDRFHLPKDPAEAEAVLARQKAAFAAGLAQAAALACPVVVHSRGAFAECVAMIDASGVEWSRVVFHCFVEGAPEIAVLRERGGWASFTGVLTYKSAETVREAARSQGLARFMVETDAPYLTPVPHRGKPNEVAYVRYTAEYAADEIFGVPFEELAAVSTANARAFFGI